MPQQTAPSFHYESSDCLQCYYGYHWNWRSRSVSEVMSHCCKLSTGERSRKSCCGCRGATECGKWLETFADPVCWAGWPLCLLCHWRKHSWCHTHFLWAEKQWKERVRTHLTFKCGLVPRLFHVERVLYIINIWPKVSEINTIKKSIHLY